ncbi:hypothetical protein Q7I39_11450 [Aeromonas veronii]
MDLATGIGPGKGNCGVTLHDMQLDGVIEQTFQPIKNAVGHSRASSIHDAMQDLVNMARLHLTGAHFADGGDDMVLEPLPDSLRILTLTLDMSG